LCAPALIAASLCVAPLAVRAQSAWPRMSGSNSPELTAGTVTRAAARPDYAAGLTLPTIDLVNLSDDRIAATQTGFVSDAPGQQYWIAPQAGDASSGAAPLPDGGGEWIAPQSDGITYFNTPAPAGWSWQILPDSVIYHSYQAGVHEPRFSVVMFGERDGRDLWDATLGGRIGVLRYGDTSCFRPQG
jgi:hypothetical protein